MSWIYMEVQCVYMNKNKPTEISSKQNNDKFYNTICEI